MGLPDSQSALRASPALGPAPGAEPGPPGRAGGFDVSPSAGGPCQQPVGIVVTLDVQAFPGCPHAGARPAFTRTFTPSFSHSANSYRALSGRQALQAEHKALEVPGRFLRLGNGDNTSPSLPPGAMVTSAGGEGVNGWRGERLVASLSQHRALTACGHRNNCHKLGGMQWQFWRPKTQKESYGLKSRGWQGWFRPEVSGENPFHASAGCRSLPHRSEVCLLLGLSFLSKGHSGLGTPNPGWSR